MHNIFITQKITKNKYNKIDYLIESGWYNLFKGKKVNLIPLANVDTLKSKINSKGVIIHGGNDLPTLKKNFTNILRKKTNIPIIKYAIKKNIPILAVCYGFQLLASIFRCKLKKTNAHIRKNHKIGTLNITREKKIIVNSYHNYKILNVPNFFDKYYALKDRGIELAISKNKKILCTMFHPERKNVSQKIINKIIFKHFNL